MIREIKSPETQDHGEGYWGGGQLVWILDEVH